MAINFPNSPSVNDTHTVGNRRWIWTGSTWDLDRDYINDLEDVSITGPANGQLLVYDGTDWKNEVMPSNEPMGHEDITESTISFNNASRTFTITPTGASFTVWVQGKRFVKTTSQSVQVPNNTGLYYIYFNSSGTLAQKTTYFTWDQDAPTAYVYWNSGTGAAYYVADERHGITLDWQTHEYLHRTRGAVIASGFGATDYTITGDGSLDTHAQITLTGGTFFDEDMEIVIVDDPTPAANTFEQDLTIAKIPMFYHSGSTGAWIADTATEFPMKQGALRARYNLNTAGTWSTADITSNDFGITWIVATNNIGNPIIGILGQENYNTIGAAEAASWDDLNLTNFPSVEFRPLYKVIYQTNNSYASTPHTRLRGVWDLRQIGAVGAGYTANPVSDHGLLSGLADDDHTQYLTTGRHDVHDHSTALGTASLGDLGDVTVTGPANGEILRYNGTQWVNDSFTPVANANLADLADVNVTGPSGPVDGEYLRWNGTAWVNDDIDLGADTVGNYVASVSAGTGVSITGPTGEGATPTISIGQAVGTTDNVTFNDVIVSGNLTVSGTSTTLNTENLYVEDNFVTLNYGATGAAALDAGIEVERGTDPNVAIRWNETQNYWEYTNDGTTYYQLQPTGPTGPTGATGAASTVTGPTGPQGGTGPTGASSFSIDETTLTSNSATTIALLPLSGSDAAEFTVKITQGNRRYSTKALSLHDGSNVDLVQYGELSMGATEAVPGSGATTWVTRTSNFGNTVINSVAFGNNLWIAGGSYGQLRTSTDAITWVTRTSNFENTNIQSIAFGNNLWVAGGYYGELRTSTDAVTWVTRTSNFTNDFFGIINSIAYGNNLWVAGGFVGNLRTSTDAITWVTRTSNFGNTGIRSIAFGNNLWVAGGVVGQLRTSTDAITWVTRTSNFGNEGIQSIAFGNGLWVAGGYSGQLRTSTDAITWVTRTSNFGNTNINLIAYGNNLWVAGGNSGQLRTSTDAVTWVTRTSNFGNTAIFSIAFGNNLWVAGGNLAQLRTSATNTALYEIPVTLSADILGSDVRLRATITDAATTSAQVKVLKTAL